MNEETLTFYSLYSVADCKYEDDVEVFLTRKEAVNNFIENIWIYYSKDNRDNCDFNDLLAQFYNGISSIDLYEININKEELVNYMIESNYTDYEEEDREELLNNTNEVLFNYLLEDGSINDFASEAFNESFEDYEPTYKLNNIASLDYNLNFDFDLDYANSLQKQNLFKKYDNLYKSISEYITHKIKTSPNYLNAENDIETLNSKINNFANYYCEKYNVETLNDEEDVEEEYNNYINQKERVRER